MHPHISKGRGSGWDESTGNTACLIAWGARRLCRRRTIAGGFGNPFRVPMSKGVYFTTKMSGTGGAAMLGLIWNPVCGGWL